MGDPVAGGVGGRGRGRVRARGRVRGAAAPDFLATRGEGQGLAGSAADRLASRRHASPTRSRAGRTPSWPVSSGARPWPRRGRRPRTSSWTRSGSRTGDADIGCVCPLGHRAGQARQAAQRQLDPAEGSPTAAAAARDRPAHDGPSWERARRARGLPADPRRRLGCRRSHGSPSSPARLGSPRSACSSCRRCSGSAATTRRHRARPPRDRSRPPTPEPTPVPEPTPQIYVIKEGDTLSKIATRLRADARGAARRERGHHQGPEPDRGRRPDHHPGAATGRGRRRTARPRTKPPGATAGGAAAIWARC